MSFKTIKTDHYTLIKFSTTKLDAIVSPDLKAELVFISKQGEKNIIVDLESVKYCDSSGLSALLIGNRICNEAKGCFVLSSVQPAVEKLIIISQLDSIFNIKTTTQEAIDSIC
ncbi:MAG: anti-anti-sigma factor [Flavobacteriales bacterium CG_4_10_14_0_2_um_filter_32_8]|nr:MAG: anti-anti-sigma factor [Flavobacteriales bacterium CG_4_10_14_0_2_um_filter_32_8]PJB15068.1 MAG: anti-anti-sigma factor [Flavobacteriales bacterium CG_4_9_14_3_um_filter_32_8]